MTAGPPESAHLQLCGLAEPPPQARVETPSTAVCPLFFREQTMKSSTPYLLDSMFSVAVFAAIALAVASTAYQIFNPDGGLIVWISGEWQHRPATLALLCVAGCWRNTGSAACRARGWQTECITVRCCSGCITASGRFLLHEAVEQAESFAGNQGDFLRADNIGRHEVNGIAYRP